MKVLATFDGCGAFVGMPKGSRQNCSEVLDAAILPADYAKIAGHIADRRIMLTGYRLADLLRGAVTN